MTNILTTTVLGAGLLLSVSAFADPVPLTTSQLDQVAAGAAPGVTIQSSRLVRNTGVVAPLINTDYKRVILPPFANTDRKRAP